MVAISASCEASLRGVASADVTLWAVRKNANCLARPRFAGLKGPPTPIAVRFVIALLLSSTMRPPSESVDERQTTPSSCRQLRDDPSLRLIHISRVGSIGSVGCAGDRTGGGGLSKDDASKRWLRAARVAGILLLSGTTFLLVAAIDGPISIVLGVIDKSRPPWIEPTLRLLLAGFGFLCLGGVRKTWATYRSESAVDNSPGPPQKDWPEDLTDQNSIVAQAETLVFERYQQVAINTFCQMLFNNFYLARVTEEAEFTLDSVRLRVNASFAFSHAEREALAEGNEYLPIPLIKASKGELIDNLYVWGPDDSTLTTLTLQETRGLVAIACRSLFDMAFPESTSGNQEIRDRSIRALTRIVCRSGRNDHASFNDEYNRAIEPMSGVTTTAAAKPFRNFCQFFAFNYIVAVEVPAPAGIRFSLRYTRTLPLLGRTETSYDRWRTRFGLKPRLFRIPMNLAFAAPSYHFRMQVGEGQYAMGSYVVDGHTGLVFKQDDLRRVCEDGYLRTRYQSGLSYVHLYTRQLDKVVDPPNLHIVTEFDETPPGAVGAAGVVAAITAVLIISLAFVLPTVGEQASSDLSALLFAVPLFAATMVGHSVERMQRSSLATYASLAVTGVASLISAILYVAHPHAAVFHGAYLGWLHLSVDVAWFVLGMIAIGNSIAISSALARSTTRYMKHLKRSTTLMSKSAASTTNGVV
jgi:hypothetical protein